MMLVDQLEAKAEQLDDGDILVITAKDPLPDEAARQITAKCRQLISNLGVRAEVLVLDNGLGAHLLKTSDLSINEGDET